MQCPAKTKNHTNKSMTTQEYKNSYVVFFAPLEAVQLSFIQSLSERFFWGAFVIFFITIPLQSPKYIEGKIWL
jgi:hypothetical protein